MARATALARVAGFITETVSRQMTRLKNAGVIGLPGGRRVEIHDPDALAEAAEELV